jgi:hypothetical protein
MVGTGKIVANRFGGMAAEEHRSGVADAREHRFGLGNGEFEMFGCEPVDHRGGLVETLDNNDRTVGVPACPRDGFGRQRRQRALDRRRHRIGKIGIIGDQDRLAGRVMLGLAEQVGGDPVGIVVGIGNDQYLGRPRDHIDADAAIKLALGLRDPGIAGANNHIDRRNRRGAIGECTNSLRAADPPHFINARQGRRR